MSGPQNKSTSLYIGCPTGDDEIIPLTSSRRCASEKYAYATSDNDDDNDDDDDEDDDEEDSDDDDQFRTDSRRLISTPSSKSRYGQQDNTTTTAVGHRSSENQLEHRSLAGHGRPRQLHPYTTSLGSSSMLSGRPRSSKLYSPWTIFTLTILFFLFLYIPLFTQLRDTSGMYPIAGWGLNTTRDTTYYVLPSYNTTIIDAANVCDDRLFLLIVVCSSASNFESRESIRQTWANMTEFNYSFFRKAHAKSRSQYLDINYPYWQNYTTAFHVADGATVKPANNSNTTLVKSRPEFADFAVKIVFLVGQIPNNETQARIVTESEQYGDVIQEGFLDSYNNLTLKSIMMLKWVTINCGDRVQFLMKCDDDTFVNVPNLLHALLGGTMPAYNATVPVFDQRTIKTRMARNRLRTAGGNVLIGTRFCHAVPILDTSSKWYTPVYMFSGSVFPNYLSGTGYVMSMDVAARLYNASLVTPIFHLEDVYLTGICAEEAHIRPANHHLFSYTSYMRANPCELKGMITKHRLSALEMRRAYAFVQDLNGASANCSKPDRYLHVRKVKPDIRSCS